MLGIRKGEVNRVIGEKRRPRRRVVGALAAVATITGGQEIARRRLTATHDGGQVLEVGRRLAAAVGTQPARGLPKLIDEPFGRSRQATPSVSPGLDSIGAACPIPRATLRAFVFSAST